jgi:hypothetical protein
MMAVKMKPYRCQNQACSEDHAGRLIFDFWAERPVCPKCGADGKIMPNVVIPLVLMHFDPPSKVFGRGMRILACTRKGYGQANVSVTGNPTCVNCPDCKKSAEYLAIADEWGIETVTPLEELPAAIEAGKAQVEALKELVEAAA